MFLRRAPPEPRKLIALPRVTQSMAKCLRHTLAHLQVGNKEVAQALRKAGAKTYSALQKSVTNSASEQTEEL